mmetsp:Transcript_20109/g.55639  ORF Transcript_20109/g.55639 Transcript_20109/m.55639 type:complete len:203 (+) Transcript_20109:1741-2349(+)
MRFTNVSTSQHSGPIVHMILHFRLQDSSISSTPARLSAPCSNTMGACLVFGPALVAGGAGGRVARPGTAWICILLAPPGHASCVPLMTTMRSPRTTMPISEATDNAPDITTSVNLKVDTSSGTTPRETCAWRITRSLHVNARIGIEGRQRATNRAIWPDSVSTMTSFAPICSAACTAETHKPARLSLIASVPFAERSASNPL